MNLDSSLPWPCGPCGPYGLCAPPESGNFNFPTVNLDTDERSDFNDQACTRDRGSHPPGPEVMGPRGSLYTSTAVAALFGGEEEVSDPYASIGLAADRIKQAHEAMGKEETFSLSEDYFALEVAAHGSKVDNVAHTIMGSSTGVNNASLKGDKEVELPQLTIFSPEVVNDQAEALRKKIEIAKLVQSVGKVLTVASLILLGASFLLSVGVGAGLLLTVGALAISWIKGYPVGLDPVAGLAAISTFVKVSIIACGVVSSVGALLCISGSLAERHYANKLTQLSKENPGILTRS